MTTPAQPPAGNPPQSADGQTATGADAADSGGAELVGAAAVKRFAHDRPRLLAPDMYSEYGDMLPPVAISRSPHNNQLLYWRIDTVGLDGLFWDHERPIRRHISAPPGFKALTGAMRLSEPVETFPFEAIPGPGKPFVIPDLLEHPDVFAVISQLAIGRHTGWPIAYYGPIPRTHLVNEWGANTYVPYDAEGNPGGWAEKVDLISRYEYRLAPWIRTGKLLWITPDDPTLTLRHGTPDCPYLDIEGSHHFSAIRNGEIKRRVFNS